MVGRRLKRFVPLRIAIFFRRFRTSELSKAREESNIWLRHHAAEIEGAVLSIGSSSDKDREGGIYRDYFKNVQSYTTSEVSRYYRCNRVLDVRSIPEIDSESFDCIFCSGVLEHVDDYLGGLNEITRILKPGGILLLGLPFRQALHGSPHDYWRFTEYGIRHLLQNNYDILDLKPIDCSIPDFPASYWVKAKKR